ncbi:MAG: sigma-70 family RNA polymerase sigma factor [Rhodocyclaceae bacterium]
MTDPDTVRRFEALVLPHMHSAYDFARWLTHNDQDARDIVQDAFLRAFRFFDGFHGSDARPWLLSIVRNTFYTWYEQNRMYCARAEVFDEVIHGQSLDATAVSNDPEALLIRRERNAQVAGAVRQLRIEYREVIVLRELEDLAYREIANIVGVPIGTVMSRLARARQQLAALLVETDREG